jgi:hypothetical protein
MVPDNLLDCQHFIARMGLFIPVLGDSTAYNRAILRLSCNLGHSVAEHPWQGDELRLVSVIIMALLAMFAINREVCGQMMAAHLV